MDEYLKVLVSLHWNVEIVNKKLAQQVVFVGIRSEVTIVRLITHPE